MGAKTKIEWTDATWNPVSGCTQISEGCRNCYAKEMARRFSGMKGFPNGFDVTFFPDRLSIPVKWKKPRTIFVCSTGDLFHKDVEEDWLIDIFMTMIAHPRHTYFVLTKRPERMKDFLESHPILRKSLEKHVWFGTSVENQDVLNRMEILASIKGINRFVSFEPLIGEIWFTRKVWELISKMHWVICGAETGGKARPIPRATACELSNVSRSYDVPFFFKKWGNNKGHEGMVRQFPDFRKGYSE